MGFDNLFQWKYPVDDGFQVPVFYKVVQEGQVFSLQEGRTRSHGSEDSFFSARYQAPRHLKQVLQPGNGCQVFSVLRQGVFTFGERTFRWCIEDNVVGFPVSGEVFLRVTDYLRNFQGFHRVDPGSAADSGHFGAKLSGKLDGNNADAAGSTDNKHLVAFFILPTVSGRAGQYSRRRGWSPLPRS